MAAETLSRSVWDEWTALEKSSAILDEITGALDGMTYTTAGDVYIFENSRVFVAKKLLRFWAELGWNKDADAQMSVGGSKRKGSVALAIKAGALERVFSHKKNASARARNWNWVRGLFGSCGALYIPKTGYYLSLRPPEKKGVADRLQTLLKSSGFAVGVRKSARWRELTLRDQQQIVTFLSRLGMMKSALKLEETAIFRSVRNRANKLVNCDAANINKSLGAASSQLELIKKTEEAGILEKLPEPLRELVFARKKNPSVTLRELGQTLPRPISKSTVEYRWRKLEATLSTHLKGDDANVLGKS